MALRASVVRFDNHRLSQRFLNPTRDKKEIPEKSRPFDCALATRLNDSRKGSIPFQSSPYVCNKHNNRHTGAEADRVGAAVRGCFALFDAGGFSLNAWNSAARDGSKNSARARGYPGLWITCECVVIKVTVL